MKLRKPENLEVLIGATIAGLGETVFRADTPLVVVALGATGLGLFGLKVGEGIGKVCSGIMGIGVLTLASLGLSNFNEITTKAERDAAGIVDAVTGGPSPRPASGHKPNPVAIELASDGVDAVVVIPGSVSVNGCSKVLTVPVGNGEGPDSLAGRVFKGTSVNPIGAKLYSNHPGNMIWPNDNAKGVYKTEDPITGVVTFEPIVCG